MSVVQAFLSSQIVAVNTQSPVAGSQVSVVQALLSMQTTSLQRPLDTQLPDAASQV
jgi:hypothetical protein